jgi:hypothetical protein
MTRRGLSGQNCGGAVLAITLVLLLLLALTVAAMVRSNSVQALLDASRQRSAALEQLAEQAVAAVISEPANFMQCQTSEISCGTADVAAADAQATVSCSVTYVGERSGLGCSINLDSTAPCHVDYLWDITVDVADLRRVSSGDFSHSVFSARQGVAFFHRGGLPGCDG